MLPFCPQGELMGASIALMRRSLFRDWLTNAQDAASAAASAIARVAAAEENALQLTKANELREAELAADKRLHHGGCWGEVGRGTSN
jgi:hypothetical protein